MDPILRYAFLSLCLLIIALIPFFIIRIYMFTVKSHFLSSKTAQQMSLVANLLSFILFLGLLIFFTIEAGFLSISFYVIMVLTFILILLIYKHLDMRPTNQSFITSYTTIGSKKKLVSNLSSIHLPHISTKSTFSFLTHVKFLSLNPEEIDVIETEIKGIDHVYISFKGIVAHVLFVVYVVLLSIAFVSFILFFNILIN